MKKIWIIAVPIVVTLSVLFALSRKGETKENVEYEKVTVALANIEVKVVSNGLVKPENRLDIKPPISGRVDRVVVEEGVKVSKGDPLAWLSSTERAAMLDAASGVGPAEVKKWEEFYRPSPMLAPINGTVIKRNFEAGQTFSTADIVFVMSDRLAIKAQVDETDLSQIQLGQAAEVTLDSYPGEVLTAKVKRIAFDAITTNNVTTFLIDVIPDRMPDYVRSGMTANVSIKTRSKNQVLAVPAAAIGTKQGKSIVMVETDGKKETREVRLGVSDGRQIEVLSGLKAGEIVLVPSLNLGKAKENASNPLGVTTPRPGRGSR